MAPIARKADLALAFNPYHGSVESELTTARTKYGNLTLSQMSDAYTSTLILGCGIEVKESGGDYNEALLQLSVWSAAGLEKMWSLFRTLDFVRPLIGVQELVWESRSQLCAVNSFFIPTRLD